MIVFVFTRAKLNTHKEIHRWPGMPPHRLQSWDQVIGAKRLPRATYILGDFDRLSAWECELAAHVYRQLAAAGLRVLNDPARVLQRAELLGALHRAGINPFRAWRYQDRQTSERFPVFLRTTSGHRGVATGLLASDGEIAAEAERLVASGVPERELLVVEYAPSEPRPGLFRKRGAYRIGDRFVVGLSAHDTSWVAKFGVSGIATDDVYDEENRQVAGNQHPEPVARAFDLARVEYGRADFGDVGGGTALYEINTNPSLKALKKHRTAIRLETDRHWRRSYAEAMAEIDTATGGRPVAMDDGLLRKQRARDGLLIRSRYRA